MRFPHAPFQDTSERALRKDVARDIVRTRTTRIFVMNPNSGRNVRDDETQRGSGGASYATPRASGSWTAWLALSRAAEVHSSYQATVHHLESMNPR